MLVSPLHPMISTDWTGTNFLLSKVLNISIIPYDKIKQQLFDNPISIIGLIVDNTQGFLYLGSPSVDMNTPTFYWKNRISSLLITLQNEVPFSSNPTLCTVKELAAFNI